MISTHIAQETDINVIYELGKNIPEFEVNEHTVLFWPKEILKAAITSQDVCIIVARAENDQIVGFIIANCNKTLKKAIIENIYVKPENRGQGVSAEMLAHMLSTIKDYGCEYVATLVPQNAEKA